MKILQELDRDKWKNFVHNHAMGNIFHTVEMFEVFQRTKGYEPNLWTAVADDGRVLALLLPVEIRLINWLRMLTSREIVFGGPLWEQNPDGQKGLALLLEQYKKKSRGKFLFTEMRNISKTTEIQPILRKNKYFYEDHLNYLINLDCHPNELMQKIGKRTRKHISRGLRRGELTVERIEDREKLYVCYELLEKTYRLSQVPLADISMFEAAFDILYPKGMVQFILASVNGVAVASSVELVYKDIIYGWYSGLDREYSSLTPNELIIWNILKWGAENHYRLYDFGGAGKPDEEYGVRDFKAKFGGDLVNFGRNKHIPMPLFYKISEYGYSIARRFLY